MVKINPPPPAQTPNPIYVELPEGQRLQRIYDPTRHNTQALTFRYFGPIARFDHHRAGNSRKKNNDPERGVYYAAFTLSGCLVEVFGDTGVIEIKNQELAFVELVRSLKLLDLRKNGAMRAGSVAALAKIADRELSQAWSRYFYDTYIDIEGIVYYNAHNDEEALVLYERAVDSLRVNDAFALNDSSLRPHLQRVALDNHLVLAPW